MIQFVFLLEEESMKACLNVLLPRILPDGITFKCIPHEGKQDLEKSIPRKLKGWNQPNTRFVIVRDKDSADCIEVKNRLLRLCQEAGRNDVLVRIACHELESWFLGDLNAVEQAFKLDNIAKLQHKRKYKNPDQLSNASEELEKIVKSYRKVSGAKEIAQHLSLKNNCSISFNNFLKGVSRLINTTN